jgi:ketosteroid isomerase-like protein
MKKQFILCCVVLIAAAPLCFAQGSPSKSDKSATKEAMIMDLEKSVAEAFKNKQTDAFKKYLAPDFSGIDADGIKDADAEVADIEKYDVRENSFADMKVAFPSANIAVVTYKVTTQATSAGKDTSGTYNSASVWTKRDGKWLIALHTFVKAK